MKFNQKLRSLVFQGLKQKFDSVSDELLDRLDYELSHFKSDKVCQYVLDYKRIIDVCNRLNIVRAPGRGSTASSLVMYCLDITTINPMEYGLHFEKICSEDELNHLNIETDIPAMSMELVLNEIQKEFSDNQLAKVMIPVKEDEVLRGSHVIIHSTTYKPHACAVVIVPQDDDRLIEIDGNYYMPFQDYQNEDNRIWHYRFNLLSLKHLDPIQKFVNKRGVKYHPRNYPIDDKATYDLFSRGATKGVYMFETDSVKKYLKQLKPINLRDIILLHAVFRPPSLRLLPEIIKSKHSWKADYNSLSVIELMAEESYGIPFYQETFVELMEKLAGFTRKRAWYYFNILARTDNLENKNEFVNLFIKGCTRNKIISEETAVDLAKFILNYTPRSFQKAHSVCYGLMAYWMGYYNVHFR